MTNKFQSLHTQTISLHRQLMEVKRVSNGVTPSDRQLILHIDVVQAAQYYSPIASFHLCLIDILAVVPIRQQRKSSSESC